ncbi:MAG: TlpA family protein disulfide reductase [Chthoniobacterales bacterium]
MNILPLIAILLSATLAQASDADTAWAAVEKLRQGPGQPTADAPEEVVKRMRAHLAAQERALAEFITRHPDDPRRYEAEIEYAGVLSTLGASLTDRMRVDKALQRLSALERSESAPFQVRADAAFQRITTTMQTVNLAAAERPGETARARNTILESAQNFAGNYPEDRRAARLLAEAATLLDDQPSRKRKVLEQAQSLARDEATRQRIDDDLKRLGLLGQTMDISFETLRDGRWTLAEQQGRVTVLIFWAGWSPPSVAWLAEFGKFARNLPGRAVDIATVSLDQKAGNASETLAKLGMSDWPTACSGKGWEDPLVRRLGINALPTVFVFDKQGRLRTLNARQGYEPLIRKLLAER